jgi:hypothetical protein
VFGVVFITSLGYFFYLYNHYLTEKIVVNQVQTKQLTIAKSGAEMLAFSLIHLEDQLLTLSRVPEVARLDAKETRVLFEHYLHDSPLLFGSWGRMDEKGKLVVGEGSTFPAADFVLWAKNPAHRGKVYLSSPFPAKQGSVSGEMVVMVTPTYYENRYTGLIVFLLPLDRFIQSLVKPLQSEKDGNAFLVDSQGKLLAGESALLERNLIAYADESKWEGYASFVDKFRHALEVSEGMTVWKFRSPGQHIVDSFVGFHEVHAGEQRLTLFVTAGTTAWNSLAVVFQPLEILLLSLLFTATLGTGILVLLIGNVHYKDGYIRGYERGRKR